MKDHSKHRQAVYDHNGDLAFCGECEFIAEQVAEGRLRADLLMAQHGDYDIEDMEDAARHAVGAKDGETWEAAARRWYRARGK